VKVKDDPLTLEIRLSKSGYGSLREVQSFTAREFLQCLVYDRFIVDYESECYRLARKE